MAKSKLRIILKSGAEIEMTVDGWSFRKSRQTQEILEFDHPGASPKIAYIDLNEIAMVLEES